MSFVITQPEALLYAAGKLEALGSALAAESAAAAPPTTAIAPAAADEISALQAALFTAYGELYQSINAQAASIHQQFVETLDTSAGSYQTAEATNSAATASPFAAAPAVNGAATPAAAADPPAGSGLLNIGDIGVGNFGSATSDLLAMAGGGLLVRPEGLSGPASSALAGTTLTDTVQPLAGTPQPAGAAGAPMVAGLGQATAVGRLSVPPSWAAGASAPTTPPAAPTLTGWTTAAPQGPSVAGVPAGMPAVATAGKLGGLGAPRYGVKPTVMGRPTVA
ncbi:PE domain-containing protein [Mycobacterium sp. SMC-2]|uniref:PPE family protein, SVP subgroup n=1 Tax=Mycobacterium sp. SMC-2 TaxID=2857058 RepID=UPI0021B2CC36|nr:PE domain-containing protein [Mycobacterium sp. SMC-2]UXA05097.1 PE domain-containing protein [Mycobacterium sp. SMC-2]